MGDETPRQALAERLSVSLNELNRLVFDSDTATRAMVGELTIDQHWQAIGSALNVAQAELPQLRAEFWSADVINEELVQFIHQLRKDYKIGLLSNAWDDLRQVLETRIPIGHLFDDMVISAEVRIAKPELGIYLLAVERLGIRPQEAAFVDDILENVEAARRAGLNAIHYTTNQQLFSELKALDILPLMD